jgi:hypothetical protein
MGYADEPVYIESMSLEDQKVQHQLHQLRQQLQTKLSESHDPAQQTQLIKQFKVMFMETTQSTEAEAHKTAMLFEDDSEEDEEDDEEEGDEVKSNDTDDDDEFLNELVASSVAAETVPNQHRKHQQHQQQQNQNHHPKSRSISFPFKRNSSNQDKTVPPPGDHSACHKQIDALKLELREKASELATLKHSLYMSESRNRKLQLELQDRNQQVQACENTMMQMLDKGIPEQEYDILRMYCRKLEAQLKDSQAALAQKEGENEQLRGNEVMTKVATDKTAWSVVVKELQKNLLETRVMCGKLKCENQMLCTKMELIEKVKVESQQFELQQQLHPQPQQPQQPQPQPQPQQQQPSEKCNNNSEIELLHSKLSILACGQLLVDTANDLTGCLQCEPDRDDGETAQEKKLKETLSKKRITCFTTIEQISNILEELVKIPAKFSSNQSTNQNKGQ